MTGDFTAAREAWELLNLDDAWQAGLTAAKEQMAAVETDQPTPTTPAVYTCEHWDRSEKFCVVDGCGLTTRDTLCWRHTTAAESTQDGLL